MKSVLASLGLIALLGPFGTAPANAWTRSESFATSRGTYVGRVSGGCQDDICARSVSIIGPDGGSFSRLESISRVGPNTYEYSRTTTGSNGRSVTRIGTIVTLPDDASGF
jgi:hypothetical protein